MKTTHVESPLAESVRHVAAKLDEVALRLDALESAMLWIAEHELDRSIMVIDDEPAALLVLVDALHPHGVPIHAVTIDASDAVRDAMLSVGAAEVHVVTSMREVSDLWERVRASVVVVDLHLGDSVTGADVIRSIRDHGVRCVLVTSCTDAERTSVERVVGSVADRVHAACVVRDGTRWQQQLREDVRTLMDAVTPEPFDA